MHETSTPIIWTYQSFSSFNKNEIFFLDMLFETLPFFNSIIKEIETQAPDISEKKLQAILDKI